MTGTNGAGPARGWPNRVLGPLVLRAQVQAKGVQLVPAAAGVAVGLRRLSLAKGSDVMRRRDIGASPTLTPAGKSWAGQRFR